ncbi:hypothetical protein DBR43_08950 [Pedobacter sp. KBW06]|uniref:copper resistance protein NlpE n=1 Tax=Pedobacter sp. KBW06 TaxID=2153359 RepID=UPI000F590853|nr:copper resistance protein NlpE N-terminal domain-containing protein [Pedobacter sp. KBW06]RQO75465.1 hypothetical protein DBR43_08950 [Pedobacter sp. KBW06]
MRKVFLAAGFLMALAACTPSSSLTSPSKGKDPKEVDAGPAPIIEAHGHAGKQPLAVEAKLAKQYAGEYHGEIPNADGRAKTTLVLNADGTFKLTELFSRAEARPLDVTGHWTGESDHADVISLTENNIEPYKKFKTEEKQLRQLTVEGEVIEGKMKNLYLLKKVK